MNKIVQQLGQTIIQVLKQHQLLDQLPALIKYLEVYTPSPIKDQVTVVSSVDLTPAQKQVITQAIQSKIGSDTPIVFRTDPNLIGGLVITYQDKILDLSIKGRLNKIKQELSYE